MQKRHASLSISLLYFINRIGIERIKSMPYDYEKKQI